MCTATALGVTVVQKWSLFGVFKAVFRRSVSMYDFAMWRDFSPQTNKTLMHIYEMMTGTIAATKIAEQ